MGISSWVRLFLLPVMFFGSSLKAEIRIFDGHKGQGGEVGPRGVEEGGLPRRFFEGWPAVALAFLRDGKTERLNSIGGIEPVVGGETPATWDYEANVNRMPDLKAARFRVWLPSQKRPVRGIIVLVPGAGADGRGDAEAADWQALAREIGFGLLACDFEAAKDNGNYCYAAKGSGKLLLDALAAFAREKKHPEVLDAPLLLWGYSAGGQFNYNFACWRPKQTLAFVVNKGGFYYDVDAGPQTRAVPAIFFVGEKDSANRISRITALFERGRSENALWALCVEKGIGHDVGRSREISQRFFRSVVEKRLPATTTIMKPLVVGDGLLATPAMGPLPAAQFKESAPSASWLPDKSTLSAWKASF